MKGKKAETRIGLGFAEALTILFVALRLCGVIDWPWNEQLDDLWNHLDAELLSTS